MTLNQLKYFCTAAQFHSITKAAQELFITQPTISSAIRELEIEFKITLFYRMGNQLTLTEEGDAFYQRASELLRASLEMQDEFTNHARLHSTLRIGTPPMLSTVFFPELLTSFQEQYPDISARLDEYGSVRACELVQNDHLDLAMVNMELYNLDKFNHEILTKDQLMYCVSPKHPLFGADSVTIEQLAEERMLFFNSDSVQNTLLNTRFHAAGITPKIIMRSSQLYTTLNFIEDGTCGCFLFSCMASRFPSVHSIPLSPPIPTKIGLVWKKGKFVSNHMQKFINFTVSQYQAPVSILQTGKT